jgi:cbb3-type cytochrome oxidase maturation protein
MESIYLLIPLSIILLGVAIWGFFWAVNRGQFENLEESQNAALEEDTPLNPDAKPDSK